MEPEPDYCVQYHKWYSTLAKISNDKTLNIHQRLTAKELRESIEKTHNHRCMKCGPATR